MVNPTADEITVGEVLSKLEAEFAAVARAVENGEYALWVGSGISRQAPDLGDLIERAFDYIRVRAIAAATATTYMPALQELLRLAEIEPRSVEKQYQKPLVSWTQRCLIIERLWNKYSQVLDIRVDGEEADFILWEAINIRQAFDDPPPPAAEHLCIAILILEGAVQEIASANWDGFIEAGVKRLTNGIPEVMRVVVDPDQLRTPAGRARLLKFHGCIVHATSEPEHFRRFLTGSATQIINWPEAPDFAAMCGAVVGLATQKKTLVLGLSVQDSNLQTLFSRAKHTHPWPWICAPDAPAHVFCENEITRGQQILLNLFYQAEYTKNSSAIQEATLLRAWGEQVLIALVLKLLGDKLVELMRLSLASLGKESMAGGLELHVRTLRNEVAEYAIPATGVQDRTTFANHAIELWSRMLSLFRRGSLPVNPDAYEQLSSSTLNLLAADPNTREMGLGRLGIALSLLEFGRTKGIWNLCRPISNDIASGTITARALRPGALDRTVFIIKSASEAIALTNQGAFARDNVIVIHGDDIWHEVVSKGRSARQVSAAPGRTGYTGESHISIGALLSQCDDAEALQNKFVAEIML